MTAATAREENFAAEVAKIAGLAEATVRARLAAAHPNRLVRTVFCVEWPPGIAARGHMTVEASSVYALAAPIASITGLGEAEVSARLSGAPPDKLVRDVFAAEWPEKYLAVGEHGWREETPEEACYGRLRCSVVRGVNHAARIASDLGLDEAEVRRRLDAVPGQTLVRKVFAAEWPNERTPAAGAGRAKRADTSDSGHKGTARAVERRSALPPDERSPERPSPGQGGDIHRLLQDRIANLGVVRGDFAATDKHLVAGFHPDVAWFKKSSTGHNERPYHVFEIERGSHKDRAKSIASLQRAHDEFNANITLVHAADAKAIVEMLPPRIAGLFRLCTIEACLDCGEESLKLAKVLGLDTGGRR
jgi:hypothetical protein